MYSQYNSAGGNMFTKSDNLLVLSLWDRHDLTSSRSLGHFSQSVGLLQLSLFVLSNLFVPTFGIMN